MKANEETREEDVNAPTNSDDAVCILNPRRNINVQAPNCKWPQISSKSVSNRIFLPIDLSSIMYPVYFLLATAISSVIATPVPEAQLWQLDGTSNPSNVDVTTPYVVPIDPNVQTIADANYGLSAPSFQSLAGSDPFAGVTPPVRSPSDSWNGGLMAFGLDEAGMPLPPQEIAYSTSSCSGMKSVCCLRYWPSAPTANKACADSKLSRIPSPT